MRCRLRWNTKVDNLFLFLIGFGMGMILDWFYFQKPIESKVLSRSYLSNANIQIRNINETTVTDVKKIRILCFVDTAPKYHSLRDVHLMQTWGKHCDKILLASTLTDINLGAIGFNVTDDHDHMWGKVKLMLQYIHKNFIDDYDWFYKCDDDTFLIAENLRYLLAAYSPEDPIYFGYKFNWTDTKMGYFAGGSGYALSKHTVRVFVEKILTDQRFFHEKDWNSCHLETDKRTEDIDISVCLDKYNIYPGDGRDEIKRERFIMHPPETPLFSPSNPGQKWYFERKYYWSDEGLDCCSNYTIAFHYINAKNFYTLYYLTYRFKPYGIEYRYPPPPARKPFSEVVKILDLERVNKTLRGY